MVLLYRGTKQERYTRPKKYVRKPYKRTTRYGDIRYDRQIAPQLSQKGVSNLAQKPGSYAHAVSDPENASPCIIPDLSSYPTSQYSLRQSITVASSALGVGGFSWRLTGSADYRIENIATTTDGAYTYSGFIAFQSRTSIVQQFGRCRYVGASLRLEFPGNDQNNQGIVIGSSFARGDSAPGDIVGQENFRNTVKCPVKDGIYVTYRPVDSECFQMQSTTDSAFIYGELLLHWTGLAASQNVVVHCTAHYEGISTTSSGDVNPGGLVVVNPTEFNQTVAELTKVDNVVQGAKYPDFSKAAADFSEGVGAAATAIQAVGETAKLAVQLANNFK